jgi:hypothetical protein
MSEDLTRQILEQDNARLQKEVDDLRALLARPVGVTVTGPDSAALNRVVEYLPQLTHIATNLSQVASALQRNEQTLSAIADALDGITAVRMPQDRKPKSGKRQNQAFMPTGPIRGSQSWFTT